MSDTTPQKTLTAPPAVAACDPCANPPRHVSGLPTSPDEAAVGRGNLSKRRRKAKVGDRIRFRAVTRWSDNAVTRKVVGIDELGRPLVRYGGWGNFIVRPNEVLEVLPA